MAAGAITKAGRWPIALTLLVAMMQPGLAWGQNSPGTTLVFPLTTSGELPDAVEEAPRLLTRTLADLAAASGARVRIAEAGLSEASALFECDIKSTACLAAIAENMRAEQLLYGSVSPGSGSGMRVRVMRYDRGAGRVHSVYILQGETPEALSASLRDEAAPSFEVTAPATSLPGAQPARDEPPTAGVRTQPRDNFSLSRVKPYTWAVAAGSVLLAGAGAFFALEAARLRDEVEDAPRETVEDLERLSRLESDGRRSVRLSSGLFVAGGIAAAAGATLAVIQARAAPEHGEARVTVGPGSVPGGGGIVVRWETP